ncbi:alpha/beta fold hydrolase [Oecophyllibacter saccharovorans]|uniref:alpha/beta fold hydrolase n=1 Tax=Oecophyllibacter saccharovorans TaxID=2558360 RepID=UPI00188321F0|nr:alpha/beta hydrolase [Oecophyllibacter saccharovorans]
MKTFSSPPPSTPETPVLYLCHGWGYDSGFWNAMLSHLPGWRAVCSEAGYFTPDRPPVMPEWPKRPWLAVGHSAGVQDLLQRFGGHWPAGCRGLASFNGFARFTSAPDHPQGLAERVLSRMERRLLTHPREVLADFRQLCSSDQATADLLTDLPAPDMSRLRQGLIQLRQRDCRGQLSQMHRHRAGRLFSLVGGRDPLSPARLGPVLKPMPEERADPIQVTCLPQGGHLLPLTHPAFCARWLEKIWAKSETEAEQGSGFPFQEENPC